MKVKCPGCDRTINVPDSKVPDIGVLEFKCPNCKSPVTATKGGPGNPFENLPDLGPVPDATPTPRPLDETHDIPVPPPMAGGQFEREAFGVMDSELEVLGEGKYRALLADSDNRDRITPVLKKMQFVITSVNSHEEAMEKLMFNTYDLLIINEQFDGCDPANNPTHKRIEPMMMDTRRRTFVVMTGTSFKTLDNMTAFSRSVNLVMNEDDFVNFELILKKAMKDNENFYHVYNRILVETGKEIGI